MLIKNLELEKLLADNLERYPRKLYEDAGSAARWEVKNGLRQGLITYIDSLIVNHAVNTVVDKEEDVLD